MQRRVRYTETSPISISSGVGAGSVGSIQSESLSDHWSWFFRQRQSGQYGHRPLKALGLCSLIHILRSLLEKMDAGVSISTAAGGEPEAGATSAPKAERSKPRSFTSMQSGGSAPEGQGADQGEDAGRKGYCAAAFFAITTVGVSFLNRPPVSSSGSVRER